MTAADWIAERRKLEQVATEAPWERRTWATENYSVYAPYWPGVVAMLGIGGDDARFIADARTSLPVALNALEAVLALHASAPRFSVAFRDCEVHGAACENNVQVCVHCIDCEGEAEVYPCPTMRAVDKALGVTS